MVFSGMINITRHIKSLNKLACDPHGYWSAGLPLFILNTQKTVSNDKVNFAAVESEVALGYNEWRVAA